MNRSLYTSPGLCLAYRHGDSNPGTSPASGLARVTEAARFITGARKFRLLSGPFISGERLACPGRDTGGQRGSSKRESEAGRNLAGAAGGGLSGARLPQLTFSLDRRGAT